MKQTNCGMRNMPDPIHHFHLGKAASLGLAGMVGALFTGCAYNSEMAGAVMPSIKPIYIVHGSETADSYYTLGKYYFWQSRFDKARDAFEHALRLQPNNVDALNGLGAVYDRLGQFEAAQRSYRLALGSAPDAAYIWANLGYSMLMQGRAVTAVALLEKAVNLDPANSMARQHLALASEAAAKLAASSPEIRQALPVAASTTQPPEEPAVSEMKSKPSLLAEESKPAGNSIVTVVPHEQVQHSDVILTVVPVRSTRADSMQANGQGEPPPPTMKQRFAETASLVPNSLPKGETGEVALREFQAKQNATAAVSHTETRPASAAIAVPPAPPAASYSRRSPYVLPVSMEAAAHGFGRTRVEVSNGNGVNGMARALGTAMKSEGVNVTRVTNAKPFNKPRTVIICADDMKEAAKAIAMRLPGNPSVAVGSTAYRNVEIRVVLGADAALAWNNNGKKIKVAALDK